MNNKNAEGYSDPTASQAIRRVEREEEQQLIGILMAIIRMAGFELVEPIQLRHGRRRL